jgi:hypothetical protein
MHTQRSPTMIVLPSIRFAALALSAASTMLLAGPAAAGILSCSAASCTAPTLTGQSSEGDRTSTEAFAGINWAMGRGPELVLGVRQLRTNQRHRVAGAKVETTFPFGQGGISYDKLRVRLISGHRDAMAELGGGYSFLGKAFLLSGAAQLNYVVLGTDFTLDKFKWQPFAGVNTLNRPKAPGLANDGTLTCPANYILQPAASVNASAGETVNGQTCWPNSQT